MQEAASSVSGTLQQSPSLEGSPDRTPSCAKVKSTTPRGLSCDHLQRTQNTSRLLFGACVKAELGDAGQRTISAGDCVSCSPQPSPRRTGWTDWGTVRGAGQWGRDGAGAGQWALTAARPAFLQTARSGRAGGTWHTGLLRRQERVRQQFLSTRKRAPGLGPAHIRRDSRLHSCGCCLETEEVFLGEPGTDGDVIWKRPKAQ